MIISIIPYTSLIRKLIYFQNADIKCYYGFSRVFTVKSESQLQSFRICTNWFMKPIHPVEPPPFTQV